MVRSCEAMDQSVEESRRLHTGLLDATGGLGAEVAAMVVSMQAHDMVVQRLAHADRGLDVLGRKFEELERGTLRESRHKLANAAAIATLEAAQVGSAREQLHQASLALRENVGRVVNGVRRFDDDCVMMQDYGQSSAGASGTIQVLLDGIDEICTLVEETAEAARACSRPLEPLETLVDKLSQDIAATGEYMHRLALNFQLAAARYGAGTGLEVLAARMAVASHDVSRICAAADHDVRILAGDVRQTLQGFGHILTESAYMRNLFTGRENEGLHHFRDATLSAFQKMGEFIDTARATADRMQSVDLHRLSDEILPVLEAAAGEVASVAQELCATLGAHELQPQELLALKSHYTMYSERRVHDGCLGEAETINPGTAQLVAVGGSDFGENVELF
jgi:hypothetical protein